MLPRFSPSHSSWSIAVLTWILISIDTTSVFLGEHSVWPWQQPPCLEHLCNVTQLRSIVKELVRVCIRVDSDQSLLCNSSSLTTWGRGWHSTTSIKEVFVDLISEWRNLVHTDIYSYELSTCTKKIHIFVLIVTYAMYVDSARQEWWLMKIHFRLPQSLSLDSTSSKS